MSHPPAASGTVDDLNRRFGRGHLSAIGTCVVYAVSAVVTAMVAVAVGEYAGALLNSSNKATSGAIAAGIVVAMMAVSIWGTRVIGRARGLIVALVVGMLAVLAAWSNVIASAVPAFVGLLGLGAVAFTARHLARPVGLLGAAAVSLIVALLLNLTTIAAIGGALALLIFGPIIAGHVQIYPETGARLRLLVLAMLTIVILLAGCVLEILLNGPTAMLMVIAIAGLAVILDVLRSRIRTSQPSAPPLLAVLKGGLHEY
ncbi:MAG: hypothetical protein E6I84_05480, partial [Chloroflexi bacterium]